MGAGDGVAGDGVGDEVQHELHVHEPADWAHAAAEIIADAIAGSIDERGSCTFGVSGGNTPAPVFADLAGRNIEWGKVTIVQVDERISDLASGSRNLVGVQKAFAGVPVSWLLLPVDDLLAGADVDEACSGFEDRLEDLSGSPAVLDVVHLGLGDDGHTASLVPGDPILDVADRSVAITGEYQGTRRLSLTFPVLNRARKIVWLVAGAGKSGPLQMLLEHDESIPAGRIEAGESIVVADSPALRF